MNQLRGKLIFDYHMWKIQTNIKERKYLKQSVRYIWLPYVKNLAKTKERKIFKTISTIYWITICEKLNPKNKGK